MFPTPVVCIDSGGLSEWKSFIKETDKYIVFLQGVLFSALLPVWKIKIKIWLQQTYFSIFATVCHEGEKMYSDQLKTKQVKLISANTYQVLLLSTNF